MTKYTTLINILDQLRKEAPETFKFYHPLESNEDLVNKARARSFIHLYLKVKFGLLNFQERENFVTDGANDGGIDGYFIDRDKRIVHFIQSKFRINSANFERREIKYEELINMDIDRITGGELSHENGTPYNTKFKR